MSLDVLQTIIMALTLALELFIELHNLYRFYYPVKSRDKPTQGKRNPLRHKKKGKWKKKK